EQTLKCALTNESTRAFVDTLSELQKEVDLLSLQFLQLPKDKRNSLLQLHAAATEQAASIEHIKEEQTNALNKKKEAENALKEATGIALTPDTHDSGELASARAILEKVKIDLANLEIQFNINKNEKAVFYKNKLTTLAEIEARLKQDNNVEKIKPDYQDTVKMWRNIVDSAIISKEHAVVVSMIPPLPEYPAELFGKVKSTVKANEYLKSYNEAKDYRNALVQALNDTSKEETIQRNSLLLQVGSIRAMLLNRLISSGNKWPLEFSKDYLGDLKREFMIFPHRWLVLFYFQRQAVNEILSSGFTGKVTILRKALIHLGLIVLPVFLWVRISKLADMMHDLRFYLLSKRHKSLIAASVAIWLNRLIPYISWLILLFVFEAVQRIMQRDIFNLVIPLLLIPYAQIYCIYRITFLLADGFFHELSMEAKINETAVSYNKKLRTVKTISLLLMFSLFLLLTMSELFRRALTYWLTFQIIILTGLVTCALVANKWRNELSKVIQLNFTGRTGAKIADLCKTKYSVFLCLPAVFLVIFIFIMKRIERVGEHFEFYKRISAKYYKRKLRSTKPTDNRHGDYTIPAEYVKWFSQNYIQDTDIYISPNNDMFNAIKETIVNWEKGHIEERKMVIYGEDGIGKTSLLRRLEKETGSVNVICSAITDKLLTDESVMAFGEQLFGVKFPEGLSSVKNSLKDIPGKTLVLIDDAHNLFLSRIGGFEGMKAFFNLVNTTPVKSIFWCLTFNDYSWGYLDSIFGHHRYMNIIKKMPAWSDTDIQNLILTRHRRTSYSLLYENVIEAAGTQTGLSVVSYAGSNFFRLLWEQSKGNPQAALYFWLSALRYDGSGTFEVNLPEEPDQAVVGNLSEDGLFVYAELVRHENLTQNECVEVTNLPEGIVRQTLMFGVQSKIINVDAKGRYRIATRYEYPLIKILKAKNFVYGN
ncbi:MAG TPA: ATP-binding protein, partial [Thermodesulfovibrionia bacterium]|nr:ATP-binding protein [Thermodesulfovibrionia bacterium]